MAGACTQRDAHCEEVAVEVMETYTSVLSVLSVALLLVVAGLGKKQLVWKPKPVRLLRRRRR
jgi:hypothetical protein